MTKKNTKKRGTSKGSDENQGKSVKDKSPKKTNRWWFFGKRDKKPQGKAMDRQAGGNVQGESRLDQESMDNDRDAAASMRNEEEDRNTLETTTRPSDNGPKPTKVSDGRVS